MNSTRLRSLARVATDRPARYGKQLCAHMGRKIDAAWDEGSSTGRLVFARDGVESGACRLTCDDDVLVPSLDTDPAEAERLETVVGVHLARFGAKDSLVAVWDREGAAGSTQGPFTPEEVAERNRLKREARA
ncbi:DUF2218 domain-containing protein [Actinomyces culturomici]|uniref:DUF2218 domain-containing protein n=1 Tax=Actinomyces culturomici TaxID=1926276 RepID=UPI000E1FDA6F|nr:DUF2218 domain-containing protein [Actinomyces culturomici]